MVDGVKFRCSISHNALNSVTWSVTLEWSLHYKQPRRLLLSLTTLSLRSVVKAGEAHRYDTVNTKCLSVS